MARTAPRTWVAGEVVTAAIGNTHWRDDLAWLGGGDGVSTTPPVTPPRYTRWVYPNSSGEHWTFVYRDDLDGTYPWHFIGGPSIVASYLADANVACTTGTWVTDANGPSLTIPRAGTYDVQFGAFCGTDDAGVWGAVSLGVAFNAAATPQISTQATGVSVGQNRVDRERRFRVAAVNAASSAVMKFLASGAANPAVPFGYRTIAAWPVKVS